MKKARKMKRLIINSFFSLIAGLIFANIACAQTEKYSEADLSTLAGYLETSYCPHEISVWVAGGISTLNHQPSLGKTNNSFGGAFGAGYTRFLHKNWGISSGVEYAFYQRETSIDGFLDAYQTSDIFNNPIVYRTRVDYYREKQFAGLLNIPLSLLYQTGNGHKFYASAGLKLGLPVYGKYRSSNSLLTASGYYPDYDQTEIWQNDLGYGVFNMEGNTKKLDLGVSLTGTLETGVKWNIGTGTSLYTGVFMDYGFNNTLQGDYPEKHLAEYNRHEPGRPVMNSACVLTDRLAPLAFGLKLKMAFGVGCRDLLNDRKAYKATLSARKDDFFDFIMPEVQPIKKPPMPVVVLADTIKTELPEKVQQADSSAIKERQAYLEAAKERRRKYSQPMSVLSIRNMGNYNLGIVTLTAEQESALDDYVGVMTENPLCFLDITGHTCNLGTDGLNMRIGQERADLAKDYLVEKGIAPSRIQTSSKGKIEPVFPNNNEVNRKKNRRLEIKFYEHK
jgi:outer membrane protein OmpA-like peptidoglycan-associated protein